MACWSLTWLNALSDVFGFGPGENRRCSRLRISFAKLAPLCKRPTAGLFAIAMIYGSHRPCRLDALWFGGSRAGALRGRYRFGGSSATARPEIATAGIVGLPRRRRVGSAVRFSSRRKRNLWYPKELRTRGIRYRRNALHGAARCMWSGSGTNTHLLRPSRGSRPKTRAHRLS